MEVRLNQELRAAVMLLRIVFAVSFFAPFRAFGCECQKELHVLFVGNTLRSIEHYALLSVGDSYVPKMLKNGEGPRMPGGNILYVSDRDTESLSHLSVIGRSNEPLHSSIKLLIIRDRFSDIRTCTTYGGQYLGCDPTAERLSLRLAGDEYKMVEAGLGDEQHLLLASKGVSIVYTLFVIVECFKSHCSVFYAQDGANLLSVEYQPVFLLTDREEISVEGKVENLFVRHIVLNLNMRHKKKAVRHFPLFRFQNKPSAAITTTERGLRTAKVKTDALCVYILPLDWRRLCYARCFEFEHCKGTIKHRAVQEKGYQSLSISSGSVRLSPLLERTRQCPGRSIMCQTRYTRCMSLSPKT